MTASPQQLQRIDRAYTALVTAGITDDAHDLIHDHGLLTELQSSRRRRPRPGLRPPHRHQPRLAQEHPRHRRQGHQQRPARRDHRQRALGAHASHRPRTTPGANMTLTPIQRDSMLQGATITHVQSANGILELTLHDGTTLQLTSPAGITTHAQPSQPGTHPLQIQLPPRCAICGCLDPIACTRHGQHCTWTHDCETSEPVCSACIHPAGDEPWTHPDRKTTDAYVAAIALHQTLQGRLLTEPAFHLAWTQMEAIHHAGGHPSHLFALDRLTRDDFYDDISYQEFYEPR